jgi:toluene monooxygenase system ferredoxin subunit
MWVFAVKLDELWSGEKVSLRIAGHDVLLVRLDQDVFAYVDRCAHRGLSLVTGRLDGSVLTCAAHEWQYDVRTGAGVNPQGARLRALPLRVEDGAVLVDLASLEQGGKARP